MLFIKYVITFNGKFSDEKESDADIDKHIIKIDLLFCMFYNV